MSKKSLKTGNMQYAIRNMQYAKLNHIIVPRIAKKIIFLTLFLLPFLCNFSAVAQQCYNVFPLIPYTGFVGIQTSSPSKPLHIQSGDDYNSCPQAAIKLTYSTHSGSNYSGYLSLLTPGFISEYSTIGSLFDVVLKADEYANDIILTTRNTRGNIRFATTYSVRDQERMTITPSGYVGIGNNLPRELFQIGDEMFFHSGGTKSFRINNYFDADQNRDFNITNRISLSIGASPVNDPYPGVTFMVDKQAANSPVFVFSDYDLDLKGFRILPNGNFGIGKWSPQSAFVVKSKGNTSNTSAFDVRNSSNTPLLFIQDGGNIGIGVDDPREKLVVNGTICAKEVRVSLEGAPCWDNNWPDYVFNENYNLKSIPELEKFIKENKKLPEMPSANEVSSQGIEIGDMQARMLKKIEELTLYVIELKKENESITELNKLKNNY